MGNSEQIMILVCPSCDSKFKVPDNAIPPEGRKVRCAQCGNAWHATKANELKATPRPAPTIQPVVKPQMPPASSYTAPAAEVDAGTAAQAAAIRRSVVAEEQAPAVSEPDENLFDEGLGNAQDLHEGHDDVGVSEFDGLDDGGEFDADHGLDGPADDGLPDDEHDLDDPDLDEYDDDDILARRRGELRREAELKSRARKQLMLTVGWAGLVVFILIVLSALLFMKDTVTGAFPGTNQLYNFFAETQAEALYQPETDKPLTKPITETEVYVRAGLLRDRMRVETIDGQSQVVIVGQLENTGQRAANVPKVEISIKDRSGRVLDQWVYDPPGLVLRRLSRLSFETTRPVPPSMHSVEVRPLEGTRSDNRAPSQL